MSRTTTTGTQSPPLRILSLDGGGIRGLSSLLILENVMEHIRKGKGLDQVPKPCEYFDVIGGTSTGGLGMTVDECIKAYRRVAQQAFTPKQKRLWPSPSSAAFSATQLEAAIKRTVREHCVNAQCMAQRKRGETTVGTCQHEEMLFRDKSCTKTIVLAINKDNVSAGPRLFTTYDTSTGFSECTIWQVARATSAATTFFKPIQLGRDRITFMDAAFGYNNPCEVLIKEAKKQFPDHEQMRILSIGTGLKGVVTVGKTIISVLKALKDMATTSKDVASRLDGMFGDDREYCRLDVDQGLEHVALHDWEASSRISSHTLNYLNKNSSQRAIKIFVDALINIAPMQPLAQATQVSGSEERHANHFIPFPRNKRFVGRTALLDRLRQMLFAEDDVQQVALVGLGGMGKTQVALHLAHWVKENQPGYSVFWMPAFSIASFEQACSKLVQLLDIRIPNQTDAKEAVRQYLDSEKAGRWFLIIDNLDDMDTVMGQTREARGFFDFLPQSGQGRVLITTRSHEVACTASEATEVELLGMNHDEAMELLEESLKSKDQLENEGAVIDLLTKLTNLPLAIAQAAAYMNVNRMSIPEYLRIFNNTDQDMTELLSKKLHDRTHHHESQGAVASTWILSFDQIRRTSKPAADLLAFIAYIEPKAIPRAILPPFETEQQMAEAIGTLCGYGFLSQQQDQQILEMHRLVHLATRIWIADGMEVDTTRHDVLAHIKEIFPSDDWENREIWRQFLPHALRCLQLDEGLSKEGCELGHWVGRCLFIDGRIRESVTILEYVVKIEESTLAKEHPDLLSSQHALASAYGRNGQVKKAIKLLEYVVTIKESIFANDDPDLLASQDVLASTYHTNGQIEKAIELLEYVVTIKESILANDDPDLLASQDILASAYHTSGQIEKAIELLEYVVTIKESILANDHPGLLASQHELARAYHANGQVKKAIKLLEYVVRIQESILAKDHPDRLASQHELASAYHGDGQIKKAIELLEYVVRIRESLTNDHPDRLASQHELARAYHADGQIEKAIELLEHVVRIREPLTNDHPDRLASQHELARAYHANGQIEKAIELLEYVVRILESLTNDHPDRLASQHVLASAYHANGQIEKAIELLEHVVKIEEKSLAEDHPSRLISVKLLKEMREEKNRQMGVTSR